MEVYSPICYPAKKNKIKIIKFKRLNPHQLGLHIQRSQISNIANSILEYNNSIQVISTVFITIKNSCGCFHLNL